MQSELTLSLLLKTKSLPAPPHLRPSSVPRDFWCLWTRTGEVLTDRCAPQPFSLEQGDSHLPSMGPEVTQLENKRGLFPSSPAAD